jgi:hypothetical protein
VVWVVGGWRMLFMSLVDEYGYVRSWGEYEYAVRMECVRGWTCSARMWASECRLSCTPLQVSGYEKYGPFTPVFIQESGLLNRSYLGCFFSKADMVRRWANPIAYSHQGYRWRNWRIASTSSPPLRYVNAGCAPGFSTEGPID